MYNTFNYKENMNETTSLFKCETNGETLIISAKDIMSIKPICNRYEEPYIVVKYYDGEFCLTNSIYCTDLAKLD